MFLSKLQPSSDVDTAFWFIFHDDQLLLAEQGQTPLELLPYIKDPTELSISTTHHNYLGEYQGKHCFTCRLTEPASTSGYQLVHLRQTYPMLIDPLFHVAGIAKQVLTWDYTHQYCGVCANPMQSAEKERTKYCATCHHFCYPRISPCVIVLIHDSEQVLLAYSPRFKKKMYSLIAGYIEPGETAEQAIHREVKEEVGIDVKNIRYYGSQPWPFPHSLMFGYFAEYAGGEIIIDHDEIADAQWFNINQLPTIPAEGSIAYKILKQFIDAYKQEL